MEKTFRPDAAEREANEIALRFQNSNDVMGDMSRAYHVDFSNIKIHTDGAADSKVKAAGKDALAKGNDLFFGKGIFESNDPGSKGLLAHELAHTMQQGAADGGEGAVSEMAPMGAEQGGKIWDWFKSKFSRNRGPISGSKMTDKASLDYLAAMRAKETEISRRDAVAQAMPQNRAEGLPQNIKEQMAGFQQSAVKNADDGLAAAIENGDSWEMQVSRAYQAFGHRDTGTEIGRFDRDVRAGHVFNGSLDSYAKYIMAREGSGEDLSNLTAGSETYQVGTAVQAINPAIAAGTSDLLSVIGGYLSDEKGLDYIQNMVNQVQGAKIFQGTGIDPMNYVMTTLLTGESLRGVGAMRTALQAKGGARSQQLGDYSAKIIKNLMSLPVMERLSPEKRAELPPDVMPLYEQYTALVQEIRARLAQRAAG